MIETGSAGDQLQYVDVVSRELLNSTTAERLYPEYVTGAPKSATYRCSHPHRVPWKEGLFGMVNIKYRAARMTHFTGKCQKEGSRAGFNTPSNCRRLPKVPKKKIGITSLASIVPHTREPGESSKASAQGKGQSEEVDGAADTCTECSSGGESCPHTSRESAGGATAAESTAGGQETQWSQDTDMLAHVVGGDENLSRGDLAARRESPQEGGVSRVSESYWEGVVFYLLSDALHAVLLTLPAARGTLQEIYQAFLRIKPRRLRPTSKAGARKVLKTADRSSASQAADGDCASSQAADSAADEDIESEPKKSLGKRGRRKEPALEKKKKLSHDDVVVITEYSNWRASIRDTFARHKFRFMRVEGVQATYSLTACSARLAPSIVHVSDHVTQPSPGADSPRRDQCSSPSKEGSSSMEPSSRDTPLAPPGPGTAASPTKAGSEDVQSGKAAMSNLGRAQQSVSSFLAGYNPLDSYKLGDLLPLDMLRNSASYCALSNLADRKPFEKLADQSGWDTVERWANLLACGKSAPDKLSPAALSAGALSCQLDPAGNLSLGAQPPLGTPLGPAKSHWPSAPPLDSVPALVPGAGAAQREDETLLSIIMGEEAVSVSAAARAQALAVAQATGRVAMPQVQAPALQQPDSSTAEQGATHLQQVNQSPTTAMLARVGAMHISSTVSNTIGIQSYLASMAQDLHPAGMQSYGELRRRMQAVPPAPAAWEEDLHLSRMLARAALQVDAWAAEMVGWMGWETMPESHAARRLLAKGPLEDYTLLPAQPSFASMFDFIPTFNPEDVRCTICNVIGLLLLVKVFQKHLSDDPAPQAQVPRKLDNWRVGLGPSNVVVLYVVGESVLWLAMGVWRYTLDAEFEYFRSQGGAPLAKQTETYVLFCMLAMLYNYVECIQRFFDRCPALVTAMATAVYAWSKIIICYGNQAMGSVWMRKLYSLPTAGWVLLCPPTSRADRWCCTALLGLTCAALATFDLSHGRYLDAAVEVAVHSAALISMAFPANGKRLRA